MQEHEAGHDPSVQANAEEAELDEFLDEVQTIGQFVYALAGRSVFKLVLIFVTVFFASFLPTALIIFGGTVATQAVTRTTLLILGGICIIPFAALAGFNYIAYQGLRDIVKKLNFGSHIGAALVAFIKPVGGLRIPFKEFTSRLKVFSNRTKKEATAEAHGFRGLFLRAVTSVVVFAACFTLNRIARGCVVDGKVDLERFAVAAGGRADEMIIGYFKKVLWDLTRLFISLAILILWLLIFLVTKLIGVFS